MRQPVKVPYCDVEHHPRADTPGIPTHVHKKQLEDRYAEIHRLEAENAALRARLGKRIPALNEPSERLLSRLAAHEELFVQVAQALANGETFGDPAPGSQVTDETKTGRQKPTSLVPRGGLRKARDAVSQLIQKCNAALDAFEGLQVNDFSRPKYDLSEVTKVCDWCGEGFVPMRSDARFCGSAHRIAFFRSRPVTPISSSAVPAVTSVEGSDGDSAA